MNSSGKEKTEYEVKTQGLNDEGDRLRNAGQPKEAVKQYLDALSAMKDYRQKYSKDADEQWCRKVIFMACNGMGIAYSKWGKPTDAVENFRDAIEHAPNEEARKVAESNLEKYKEAYEKKIGTRLHIL